MKIGGYKRQTGATMILTAVFAFALFATVGLAIDTGHVMLNNARLQTAVDAATLGAAIVLNSGGDPASATTAGRDTFQNFIDAPGNQELQSGLVAANLAFTFSRDLVPFDPASVDAANPAAFVRGEYGQTTFDVTNIFIQILPGIGTTSPVRAVATAGITGSNCNLIPLVLCADVDVDTGLAKDTDCTTDSPDDDDDIPDCYGYNLRTISTLHESQCSPNSGCDPLTNLGAGNYTTIRQSGPGAQELEAALAGDNECEVGDTLETQPGNIVMKVKNGINARYNKDSVTTAYLKADYPDGSTPSPRDDYTVEGPNFYRVAAAPLGNCSGIENGNVDFDYVTVDNPNGAYLAAACILLTQEATFSAGSTTIYYEFLELCIHSGKVNPVNPILYAPAKVVLFKTEGSNDS